MKCQRKGCRKAAKPRGRFCSDTHRFEQWDLEHPRADRPPRRTTPERRPSRDGFGSRIYFSPDELRDLELHLPHLSLPVAEKVRAAIERQKGRA